MEKGDLMKTCRVLIIDDDRMQIELTVVFLMRLRFDIDVKGVLTLDDAVSSVLDMPPDMVFLDNHMPPDLDFRNAYQVLRSAGYTGPVIVNSVTLDDPVLDGAVAFGASRVVDKFELREELLGELISTYCPGTHRAVTTSRYPDWRAPAGAS